MSDWETLDCRRRIDDPDQSGPLIVGGAHRRPKTDVALDSQRPRESEIVQVDGRPSDASFSQRALCQRSGHSFAGCHDLSDLLVKELRAPSKEVRLVVV